MNANTINTMSTVLGLINPALGVIGSLVGRLVGSDAAEKFAKISGQVQDAAGVVTALAPLVQSFADGNEVTAADVRFALASADTALAKFDAEIARQEAEEAEKK